jgi:Icc-related predicted phosphoesterase
MQQMENAAHLRRRYHNVELLLSCGDMPAWYLEYITSVLNVPLFYVRGNHDSSYDHHAPGGENLHRRIKRYKGLTFFGLEGCIRYNDSPVQYSEMEYTGMVMRAALPLLLLRWRRGYSVDVLATHAPPYQIHDAADYPHRGLKAFRRFLEWYRPRYMLHGHVHTYDRRTTTETQYRGTCVVNVNPITLIEIEKI